MIVLLDREIARHERDGYSADSFSYRAMKEAGEVVTRFLDDHTPPVVALCGAAACEEDDPLIGVLSDEVTTLLENEITPRRAIWGYFLDREIGDLMLSRQIAMDIRDRSRAQRREKTKKAVKKLVEEVLHDLKREREDDEEAADLLVRKRARPFFEVSDLDSEDEKEGNDDEDEDEDDALAEEEVVKQPLKPEFDIGDLPDDDDDDDDAYDVSFNDHNHHMVEHKVSKEQNVTSVQTTSLTIGKANVDKEIRRIMKENGGDEVELRRLAEAEEAEASANPPPPAPKKKSTKVIIINDDDDDEDDEDCPVQPPTPLRASNKKAAK